jgi:hypothetical protein
MWSLPPSVTSRSDQFFETDVAKSNRPLIVTFGAGTCADAGTAAPKRAPTATATAMNRLIYRLLKCGELR